MKAHSPPLWRALCAQKESAQPAALAGVVRGKRKRRIRRSMLTRRKLEFDLLYSLGGGPKMRAFTTIAAAILLIPIGAQAQTGAKTPVKTSAPEGSIETKVKGKLIDARCHTEPKCRVAADTKDYGFMLSDGTFLVFDEGGNEKVRRFLEESGRGRELLRAQPGKAKRITVIASGTRTGNTYNLESIRMAR